MTEDSRSDQYASYLSAMEGVQTRLNRLSGVLGRMTKTWTELGVTIHKEMLPLPPEAQIRIVNKVLAFNSTIEELAETCELFGGDIAKVITGVSEIIYWIQKELLKRP